MSDTEKSQDLLFDETQIKEFINNEVSSIHRPLVLEALNAESASDVEHLGAIMTGENRHTGFIKKTGASKEDQSSLWALVIEEVYNFFCTSSKKYKKERSKGSKLFEDAVKIIATALGAYINIGTGVLTGLVTIALIAMMKMGKNAWCKWIDQNPAYAT